MKTIAAFLTSAFVIGLYVIYPTAYAAVPTCTLKANTTSVVPGSTVTLTWDSTNASYGTWIQNEAARVLGLSTVIHPVKASVKYVVGSFSGTITPTFQATNTSQEIARVHTITLPEYSNGIGMDIVGRYAYVVDGGISHQMNVVDLIKPDAPVVVGSVSDLMRLNGAFHVKIVGNYAYVTATGSNRLVVIDVTNPTAPTIVGDVQDTRLTGARGIAISGTNAYVVGNNTGTLSVVNIASSTYPVIIGSVTDGVKLAGADSVALSGNYAYVTSGATNSLVAIDISNPTSPTIVGGVTDVLALGGAKEVVIHKNYAYIASLNSNSFTVIDITAPASPKIVASINDGVALKGAKNLAVVNGRFAYVTGSLGKTVTVIDLGNPKAPKISSSIQDGVNLGDARGVFVVGTRAYVVAGNKFNVFSLTNKQTHSTCSVDIQVVGAESASIDPRGQFALRGTAIGPSLLGVLIYPAGDTLTTAYRNEAVPVARGEWTLPLSLNPGTYLAEIYNVSKGISANTLLSKATFVMP